MSRRPGHSNRIASKGGREGRRRGEKHACQKKQDSPATIFPRVITTTRVRRRSLCWGVCAWVGGGGESEYSGMTERSPPRCLPSSSSASRPSTPSTPHARSLLCQETGGSQGGDGRGEGGKARLKREVERWERQGQARRRVMVCGERRAGRVAGRRMSGKG